MLFHSHLKKIDWTLFILAALMTLFGIIPLYSLSLSWEDFSFFQKQIVFLLSGILIAVVLSFLDFKALKENSLFVFILYLICVLSLAGIFLFGTDIRGAMSWYIIGPFAFEPVEITKIVLILLFAKYFSQRHVELYQARHILLSVVYGFLPIVLVFFQPDFGSAMLLLLIWLSMMLIAGIKRTHLLSILGAGLVCFLILWNFLLKPFQKERFLSFLNPYLDPGGSGYHVLQSIIAIGSSGFFGKGFSESFTQAKLGFLPEPHTDFIFATFTEMFGILGVFILFLVFGLFLWRLYKIAKNAQNNFFRLLVSGFMILVGVGAFINIAMNVGMLPITGIPFPFLSYGGSSLLSLFVGIGIIESIRVHNLGKRG